VGIFSAMPVAYLITFTTYGTRLHGGDKGSVDDQHNVYDTPLVQIDRRRERWSEARMAEMAYVMTPAEREIVRNSIVALAADRGWRLFAVHIRSNHVHAVVSAERDPGRIMSEMKARASRDLSLAGFDSSERRRWTRHGSTRHLFEEEDVEAAIRYALDEQGERMAWYFRDPRSQ
jgi:REP element-mobilizing transposase RayT